MPWIWYFIMNELYSQPESQKQCFSISATFNNLFYFSTMLKMQTMLCLQELELFFFMESAFVGLVFCCLAFFFFFVERDSLKSLTPKILHALSIYKHISL